MTRCYHECKCGKVHRFKQPTDSEYHECPVEITLKKGLFGDTVRRCSKPATHLFWTGDYYFASCDEHFNDNGRLEDLE